MSLVDLGKRLLEAARQGEDDKVRKLMASGAPFTTDWVRRGADGGHRPRWAALRVLYLVVRTLSVKKLIFEVLFISLKNNPLRTHRPVRGCALCRILVGQSCPACLGKAARGQVDGSAERVKACLVFSCSGHTEIPKTFKISGRAALSF